MYLVDANILIYAFRPDFPQHAACRKWLEDTLSNESPIAIHEITEVAFLRMVTNKKVLSSPDRFKDAAAFLDKLRQSPSVQSLPFQPAARKRFIELAASIDATGNDVPDCHLAAIALDAGCILVSADSGFARFKDLRLLNPATV